MHQTAIALYKQARELHEEFVKKAGELRKYVQSTPDKGEQADMAFAMRELAEVADAVRKSANEIGEMAQRLACVLAVAEQNTDSIKTKYCSASLKMRTIVSLPRQKTQPEEFAKLMEYLKIPRELWDRGGEESSVVKPHWPGLMSHLDDLLAAGKPLPPGVDPNKTYPEYKLVIRQLKGVME